MQEAMPVRTGGIWEICVAASQFGCEPKISLKTIFKKKFLRLSKASSRYI